MSLITKNEFEQIISDPSSNYQFPQDVLLDERLSREQKIAILKQWAFDERELEVAEEENMQATNDADTSPLLDDIIRALHDLGADETISKLRASKQGGI